MLLRRYHSNEILFGTEYWFDIRCAQLLRSGTDSFLPVAWLRVVMANLSYSAIRATDICYIILIP
jgi:hypothetical protein